MTHSKEENKVAKFIPKKIQISEWRDKGSESQEQKENTTKKLKEISKNNIEW